MKVFALLLLPALLAGSFAQAADTAPPRQPLRPISQCPDINRINEWHIIDAQTLTVRTGPFRYVMKTQYKCPSLGRYGPGISFHPSDDKSALGVTRICGDYGDTVSSHAQPPCSVESVRMIDKQQFDALTQKAERSGSGAEQPTVTHKLHH